MMQQPQPEDFVLATGETHPVREFVEKSFAVLGVTIKYVTVFCALTLVFTSLPDGVGPVSKRKAITHRQARLLSGSTPNTSALLKSSTYIYIAAYHLTNICQALARQSHQGRAPAGMEAQGGL